jgi:hypothetical protein
LLPISDQFKSRAKIGFLVLIVAGISVMISALLMAFTIDPKDPVDLYIAESAIMSVGMVMLCMGIILMKNGENIFGKSVTDMERQRLHDDMRDQVMSEMRLTPKDLEIQRAVQEADDKLFK